MIDKNSRAYEKYLKFINEINKPYLEDQDFIDHVKIFFSRIDDVLDDFIKKDLFNKFNNLNHLNGDLFYEIKYKNEDYYTKLTANIRDKNIYLINKKQSFEIKEFLLNRCTKGCGWNSFLKNDPKDIYSFDEIDNFIFFLIGDFSDKNLKQLIMINFSASAFFT